MKHIPPHSAALALFILVTSAQAQAPAVREWTDVQGRKVSAAFGGVQGDKVMFKMTNGQTVPFDLAKLSAADQDFVKAQSAPAARKETPRIAIEKRTWPEKVEAPKSSFEAKLTSEDAANRKYVYQTESFEFVSQAKLAGSVMTEVAQAFEATRSLMTQLPWGLDLRPPEGLERYQAKLFETRADYIAAGAPENSGGVYFGALNMFLVPFQSIGLEKLGKTYVMNRKTFRNDTLVHEITHQLMDEYISFIPTWVIEGTAEYAEMLPDIANGFMAQQHEKGIKEYIESFEKRPTFAAGIPSLEEHMTMDRPKWDSIASGGSTAMGTLYYRSCLIVYYFNQIDGTPKGARFMKFMDAVHGEVAATREFFANPAVKRSPEGSFSFPTSITPPEFRKPFKHLALLTDERSYETLAKEMEAGFKSKGIKISVGK